jgi:hypothetical protein
MAKAVASAALLPLDKETNGLQYQSLTQLG